MPSLKYVTDKTVLLREARRILSDDEEAEYIHKVNCANMVLAGMSPSQVGKYVTESSNTIESLVKTAEEQGFVALRGKKLSADN